jgi:hypothetical protein
MHLASALDRESQSAGYELATNALRIRLLRLVCHGGDESKRSKVVELF